MKLYEKILFTIIWATIYLPFIFYNSEIRLKGSQYEYVSTSPNLTLFYIPIICLTIWGIIKIWEPTKKQ
jgi:hypothetical protein